MPDLFVIDPNGFLQRERKGKLKPLFCPLASPNMTIKCGDWCTHFGEPVYDPKQMTGHEGGIVLTCQSSPALTGIILDQREAAQEKPTIQTGVITVGK